MKAKPSVVDSDNELGQPLVPKVTMAQLVKDKLEPGEMLGNCVPKQTLSVTNVTKGDCVVHVVNPIFGLI